MLIQKEIKVQTDSKTFTLPVEVLATLEQFSKHLDSSQAYIVAEALRAAFRADPEFRKKMLELSEPKMSGKKKAAATA